MNAIERHIETARKETNAIFDKLLADIRSNAAFIAEMNATHDPEEVGEYTATMIVEAPPSVPDLSDIEPIAESTAKVEESRRNPNAAELLNELADRMDLEQTGKTPPQPATFQQELSWELVLPDDERFTKTVGWLIKDGGTREQLEKLQTTKQIRLTPSDFDHLRNLIWYREELMKGKDGAFSLQDIISQSETTEAEKPLWEALAKTLK